MDNYEVRNRLYRLIVSQLTFDGFAKEAESLSTHLNIVPKCVPSTELMSIVGNHMNSADKIVKKVSGLDLDISYDELSQIFSPEPSKYRNVYFTTHKGSVNTAVFNKSGNLIGTGSMDGCVKIVDYDRLKIRSAVAEGQSQNETNPVIRIFYDGGDQVNTIDFHPNDAMLVYGSSDGYIRFVDYSKVSNRTLCKSLAEVSPVYVVKYHPCGEYFLVATATNVIRLYNLNTYCSYVSPNMKDQHEDFINSMVYSSNGGQYLTTSQDGSFKIWDGRSNRCTSTVKRAHDGKPVTSAVYSKNDLYYLTSGIGGMVKLWDSRSIELPIIEYAGAQSIGVQNLPTNACFNHDEKYIVYCEAKTGTLCTWNARTSERLNLSSLTHTGIVNYLVHSPTFPAFVSCGEDHRAKFWINNL